MRPSDKARLDAIEGVGKGYVPSILAVPGYGLCATYVAETGYLDAALPPFCWYRDLVLVGAMALISLGLVVAARVRSEELANGLLDLIAFPMMILSGVWFSMEGTNIWAQRLAELMPLTHLVDAARRIMLDGASLSDVSTEIAILLGIALVLLGLSARAFRWQ